MGYNLYRDLRSLLPAPRLLIGTVTAIDAGKVMVTLPDGATLSARGNATLGSTVYIRDGAIEGPAPALTVEVIEI